MSARCERANSEGMERTAFRTATTNNAFVIYVYLHSRPSAGNYDVIASFYAPGSFSGGAIYVDENGALRFRDDNGDVISAAGSGTIALDTWTKVVIVFSGWTGGGGSVSVYLAGSTSAGLTASASVAGTIDLEIGKGVSSYTTDRYSDASFFNPKYRESAWTASEGSSELDQDTFVTSGLARWLLNTHTDIDDDEGSLDLSAVGTLSTGPDDPWGDNPPTAVRIGSYDRLASLRSVVWWNLTAIPDGWFDNDLVGDAPAGGPSGAAAVTGAGAVTGTGQKNGSATASATGAGSVTGTGAKQANGTLSVTGAGRFTATGPQTVEGTASVTGAGSVTASIRKNALGSLSCTGAGSVSGSVRKGGLAAGGVTGAGSFAASVRKGASSTASATGAGTFQTTGTSAEAHTGAASVTGAARFTAMGVKAPPVGTASVTGAARAEGTGRKAASGSMSATGAARATATTAGGHRSAAAVTGAGTFTAVPIPRIGTDAIVDVTDFGPTVELVSSAEPSVELPVVMFGATIVLKVKASSLDEEGVMEWHPLNTNYIDIVARSVKDGGNRIEGATATATIRKNGNLVTGMTNPIPLTEITSQPGRYFGAASKDADIANGDSLTATIVVDAGADKYATALLTIPVTTRVG